MQPDYIDLYCERIAPGLWNEPLNALTNLAFIVALGVAFLLIVETETWLAVRLGFGG